MMQQLNSDSILRQLSRQYDIVGNGAVMDKLSDGIAAAEQSLAQRLDGNPYKPFWKKWHAGKDAFEQKRFDVAEIQKALAGYSWFAKFAGISQDGKFWQAKIDKLKPPATAKDSPATSQTAQDAAALFELLLDTWRKQLQQIDAQWQAEQTRDVEKKLMKNLRDWLDVHFHKFGEETMIAELEREHSSVLDDDVCTVLSEKIREAESSVPLMLGQENDPYAAHAKALSAAQADLAQGNSEIPAIESDLRTYGQFPRRSAMQSDAAFWRGKIDEYGKTHGGKKQESAKALKARKALRGHLQERWQKDLDVARVEWCLDRLREYRQKLLENLQEWLELVAQMREVLSCLSISPGVLYDLSKGGIHQSSDGDTLLRWAKYLRGDEGVRQLCEMLGRLRTAARVKREELIRTTEIIRSNRVDVNSREEIVGVTTGDSIEHALPSEKGLLADPDTEMLFYLKFAEKRLLQFEMQGIAGVDEKVAREETREVSEEEKKGPMIICVDTSGSMQGDPEAVAKAVALTLTVAARKDKRPCFLINFSTAIQTMDLAGEFSLENLVKFLGMSFRGGTDAAPALNHAIEKMQSEDYKRADVLVVSDFVMGDLPSETLAAIAAARENKNKFYSLAIGDDLFLNNRVRDKFDNEFVYNPRIGGIRQLLDFTDSVGEED